MIRAFVIGRIAQHSFERSVVLLCNLVMIAVTAPFTSVIKSSLSMSVGGLLKGRECVSSCFCKLGKS